VTTTVPGQNAGLSFTGNCRAAGELEDDQCHVHQQQREYLQARWIRLGRLFEPHVRGPFIDAVTLPVAGPTRYSWTLESYTGSNDPHALRCCGFQRSTTVNGSSVLVTLNTARAERQVTFQRNIGPAGYGTRYQQHRLPALL